MAKQTQVIQRFDGGVNNRDSQRDLTEGFLSGAKNIDVSHLGKIKSLGGFVEFSTNSFSSDIDIGTPSDFQSGVGLFSFKTDVGAVISDTAGEYIAYTDGGGAVYFGSDSGSNKFARSFLALQTLSNDGTTAATDLGSDADCKPVYYYANGGLRIADSDLSHTNNSAIAIIPIDRSSNAGSNEDLYGVHANQSNGTTDNQLAEALDDSETGINVDDGDEFQIGEVMKVGSEKMLITGISSNTLTVTRGYLSSTAASHSDNADIYKIPTGYHVSSGTSDAPVSADFDALSSADDPDDDETELTVDSGNICDIAVSANTAAGSQPSGLWAEGAYVVGVSYVYYGGQESKVSDFLGTIAVADGQYLLASVAVKDFSVDKFIQGIRVYVKNFNDAADEYTLLLDVDFEQGSRISLGNEFDPLVDTTGEWHTHDPLATEASTSTGGAAYAIMNQSTVSYTAANGGYDMEEHAISFQDGAFGYKTAVVANQRAFVANIRYKDSEGQTRIMGDRIQFSLVRKYDTFPQTYYHDVGTNDGDEIIKLEEFQDRLFIFKKKKLFILDISSASDFEWIIIGEYDNRGVENPEAVSKSDVGLVWANKYGLFGFSEGMSRLSSAIDEDIWANLINGTNTIVGYIPKRNQILVIGNVAMVVYQADRATANLLAEGLDSSETGVDVDYGGAFAVGDIIKIGTEEMLVTSISSNTLTVTREYNSTSAATHSDNASIKRLSRGYIYDIVSQSIVEVNTTGVILGQEITNFIRLDDDLCIMGLDGEVYRFDITKKTNKVEIITPEFNLGEPSIDKKFYSIYITYKDANNVSLTYGLDGATPTTDTIDREGTSSNALSNSSTMATHKFTFESSTTAKSIQFKLSSGSSDTETDFEIEDMVIIYRPRGIK